MKIRDTNQFVPKSVKDAAATSDDEVMHTLALEDSSTKLISKDEGQSTAEMINKIVPPEVLLGLHKGEETDISKVKEEDKLVEVMTDGTVNLYNKAKEEAGRNEAAKLFWRSLEFNGKTLTELVRDRAMAITAQSIYLKALIQGYREILDLDIPQEVKDNISNIAHAALPFADQASLNQIEAAGIIRIPVFIKPTIPGLYLLYRDYEHEVEGAYGNSGYSGYIDPSVWLRRFDNFFSYESYCKTYEVKYWSLVNAQALTRDKTDT